MIYRKTMSLSLIFFLFAPSSSSSSKSDCSTQFIHKASISQAQWMQIAFISISPLMFLMFVPVSRQNKQNGIQFRSVDCKIRIYSIFCGQVVPSSLRETPVHLAAVLKMIMFCLIRHVIRPQKVKKYNRNEILKIMSVSYMNMIPVFLGNCMCSSSMMYPACGMFQTEEIFLWYLIFCWHIQVNVNRSTWVEIRNQTYFDKYDINAYKG